MDKNISLKILTPEEIVFEGKVKGLILPGSVGSLGVYFDHAPIISKLKAGEIRLDDEKEEKKFSIQGGFFYLDKNQATVLAN